MQLLSVDLFFLEESIDKVYSQIERLRDKLKFEMYLNKPVDEDGSHFLVDVVLSLHVPWESNVLSLGLSQKVENFLGILCTQLRIFSIRDVNRVKLSLINLLLEFLELLESSTLRVNRCEISVTANPSIVGVDA